MALRIPVLLSPIPSLAHRDGIEGWMYPVENQTQLTELMESQKNGDLEDDLVVLLASSLFTPYAHLFPSPLCPAQLIHEQLQGNRKIIL